MQRFLCYLFVFLLHASKVILKILQVRLQQYANQELPDVETRFQRCRGSRDQVPNIGWIREKAKEFQKNISVVNYAKVFDSMDHKKKCGKFLEIGVQDHLTCLLRNLYTGQEETVRTRHGTTDWLKTGERVQQGCILSLGLFNLHVEFIMQNVSLDESQAGIKLSRRNNQQPQISR